MRLLRQHLDHEEVIAPHVGAMDVAAPHVARLAAQVIDADDEHSVSHVLPALNVGL